MTKDRLFSERQESVLDGQVTVKVTPCLISLPFKLADADESTNSSCHTPGSFPGPGEVSGREIYSWEHLGCIPKPHCLPAIGDAQSDSSH